MDGQRQPTGKPYRRTQRHSIVAPIELTERDRWLIEALAKLRFLTTSQILRLGFAGTRSAANKRLRKLFDAGLVRVWMRCLETENLYALAPAGRTALNGDGRAHVPRGLDRDLDHTLAINDVRIALATTLAAAVAELVSWQSDWDLRTRGRARLIPDARFSIRWANGTETPFHLEVDRNTKSATAFLRKLVAYRTAALRHGGLLDTSPVAILVVGFNPTWLERYRLHLQHSALRVPVWFATLSDVVAFGATGAIWRAAHDDQKQSLATLVALPNGSEGPEEKTAGHPCVCAPAPARVLPVEATS